MAPWLGIHSHGRTTAIALLLNLPLLVPSSVFAVSQAGGIIDAFDATARSAALGSRFALSEGGPFAVHENPAALALVQPSSVGFTHHELAAGLADDVHLRHVGGTYASGKGFGIGASFSRLNQGEQQGTDIDGNPTEPFEAYQTSIQLGAGVLFPSLLGDRDEDLMVDVALGANVKRIYDRLAPDTVLQPGQSGSGSAVTADVGAIVRVGKAFALGTDSSRRDSYLGLRGGFVFDDVLEGEITFDDPAQSDPLQRFLRLGIALEGRLFPVDPIGHLVEFSIMYERAESKVEGDETTLETRAIELVVSGSARFQIGQYRNEDGDILAPTVGVGIGLDWTGLPAGLWLDYASRPQATGLERVHILSATTLIDFF